MKSKIEKAFSKIFEISMFRKLYIFLKGVKHFFHLRFERLHSFLESFRYKNVEGLLLEMGDKPFLVKTKDRGVSKSILKNKDYQPHERQFILKDKKDGDNMLIIGGNIGAHVVKLANHYQSLSVIEADPINYDFLLMNLRLNNQEVETFNLAAYDKNTEIKFLSSTINSGGSKIIPVIKKDYYYFDKPSEIKVSARRLDDILSESYSSILMDIEGAEIFALRGMPNLLSNCHNLYMEFIPHHLENVAKVELDSFYEIFNGVFNFVEIPSQMSCSLDEGFEYLQECMKKDQAIDLVRFFK